jgi:hypothetical protein
MTVGTLGFHTSSGSGTVVVYTVPVSKRAEVSISVFNKDLSPKTVTLFIAKADTPLTSEVIQLENITASYTGFERTGIVLTAGDRVTYTTTASNAAVHVRGIESDIGTNLISLAPASISTNTTTTLYTAIADCIVNFGMSVTTATPTDTANIEVYLSETNVAGGVLFHKDLLTSFTTGFERTAVPLKTGEKIIAVTTGISGNIASHLHGYTVV